jgi:5-methyltetrahydropteroyltriglutamate--homocysteine methyltransferase
LLRPAGLRAAYRARQEGRIGAEAFRQAQDEAIRAALALQERLGFRAVTDGEFRRASYWSPVVEAAEGLGVAPARFAFHDDAGRATNFLAPRVTGKVRRARPISGGELDFLRAATARVAKLTLPSPPTLHFWAEPGAARVAGYRDDDACFADLALLYREEIADLAKRGARYLQIDEVPLAMLCDGALRSRLARDGEDADVLVGRYVELINAALSGRPAGMTVAMHLCRGNFKGQWLAEGSYRFVAERLFNGIAVDAFFLEYDTPRAGDFAPLAAMPKDKAVVLGLVSTKRPELEERDDLLRRIAEAARIVPLERLALSPQCGFASAVSGNPVTGEHQERKLRLVREVAEEVWGSA